MYMRFHSEAINKAIEIDTEYLRECWDTQMLHDIVSEAVKDQVDEPEDYDLMIEDIYYEAGLAWRLMGKDRD